jgi:triacylglycerol lipase
MNVLLKPAAQFHAFKPDFAAPPIPAWGSGDRSIAKWRENGGALSSISQRTPFTARAEPLGGDGIFGRDPASIEKGKWYFETIDAITGVRFDHLDPVFGARLKIPSMEPAQATLYGKLSVLLQSL